MLVKQIATIMNTVTKEVLGEQAIVNEDLSNIVEIGNNVFMANAVDNYVKSLVNHVGKMVFVERKYEGSAPEVLMDGWEFGSILMKIRIELPEATDNEDWELQKGVSYDPNVFNPPEVHATFFNKKVTFQIPISITETQVKESFQNAQQLNSFISMIFTAVQNSLTVKTDELIMRAINNFTAMTLYDEYSNANYGSKSGKRAVNLLYLFNTVYGLTGADALAKEDALYSPDFIKFAVYTISRYAKYLSKMSTVFNIGGLHRFTPSDKLHCVLLEDFKSSCNAFLTADTFNKEFVALPKHDTVAYWQGSGTDYAISSLSQINVTDSNNDTTECSYIIGVMFDNEAVAVCNPVKRTPSGYNPAGEFYNYWFKADSEYINDINENFVVFFLA